MRPFVLTAPSALGREDARRWAVGVLGRDLGYAGYHVGSQTKRQVDFIRTSRSAGTWIVTVLLFPLGLIFFFALKRTSSVTVLLQKASYGTEIVVSGEAADRVIEGIDYRLSADFDVVDQAQLESGD